MFSLFTLTTLLSLSSLDPNVHSLTFLQCGDQILVENESIAILTHHGTLISGRAKLEHWFAKQTNSDHAECLTVLDKLNGNQGELLDFNQMIIRDSGGFERVYTYNDFGQITHFNEARENGRSVKYLYDDEMNLIQAIDSQNGTTLFSKESIGRRINSYDHQGKLVSSHYSVNHHEISGFSQCVDGCREAKQELIAKIGKQKAFSETKKCNVRCVQDAEKAALAALEAEKSKEKPRHQPGGR